MRKISLALALMAILGLLGCGDTREGTEAEKDFQKQQDLLQAPTAPIEGRLGKVINLKLQNNGVLLTIKVDDENEPYVLFAQDQSGMGQSAYDLSEKIKGGKTQIYFPTVMHYFGRNDESRVFSYDHCGAVSVEYVSFPNPHELLAKQ